MSIGQSDIPTKSSITQSLRTDLGQSVGVSTAFQLVDIKKLQNYIYDEEAEDTVSSVGHLVSPLFSSAE